MMDSPQIAQSAPPISTDGPSGSTAILPIHHLDTPNVLHVHHVNNERHVTINILPNDVLLLVFFFDGLEDEDDPLHWHCLVHVCQRWRSLVFSSPKILDLRLVCNPWRERGVEFTSAIWPPFPVIINGRCHDGVLNGGVFDNHVFDAAIVHPTRVRDIRLDLTRPPLEQLDRVMQKPFPALTHLSLMLDHLGFIDWSTIPALSYGFLGGSAPNLQYLKLDGIDFPALPNLLLSATCLVCLTLSDIPRAGYISPEVLVTCLAVLTRLKRLTIKYKFSIYHSDLRPPPPTRTILSALTHFVFRGAIEYLEDVVSRVDAPLLHVTRITFFNHLTFDIPRLTQFMKRTTRFEVLNEVHVELDLFHIHVRNVLPTRDIDVDEISRFSISADVRRSGRTIDRWHLSLAQFFTSIFPFIYTVKHIYIDGPQYLSSPWPDDLKNTQWLETFYPFIALESLYLYNKFALQIAPALKNLVEGRVTEVLPTLRNIYLEEVQPSESGPIQEVIEKFVAARQLSGHPVTVSQWERKPTESYSY